jgi:hypothetical protein
MQFLEDPMRFLNIAFVMTALTVFVPYGQAQDGLSPEVFAACEAKSPTDFKQQLACVKEQAEALSALNALKKPKSRQIVVQPKPQDESQTDVAAPPSSDQIVETVEEFCKLQTTGSGAQVDWKACVDGEIAAHAALAAALDVVDSDIPGDPYIACRNYISAYQPMAETAYVSQVHLLQCLQAKAPTRDFGKCYQNYEHRIFNRDVRSVSAENAGYVAGCFVSTLAGGP